MMMWYLLRFVQKKNLFSFIWRRRFLGQVLIIILFSHMFFLFQKIAVWFWFCVLDTALCHIAVFFFAKELPAWELQWIYAGRGKTVNSSFLILPSECALFWQQSYVMHASALLQERLDALCSLLGRKKKFLYSYIWAV